MEDFYRKRFDVGDLIRHNTEDGNWSLKEYHISPFKVTRSWVSGSGKWLLDFVDKNGRKGISWYHHRFLPEEQPYDPTQAGDKDDDI